MKKSLLALLLASLLLLGASCTNNGDTKDTDSAGGTETNTEQTNTPDTEDLDESDSTDSDTTEKPDEPFFYSTDTYSVTEMEDGSFNYASDTEKHGTVTETFEDAFTVEYKDYYGTEHTRLILIRNENDICTLYSPDADGYLKNYRTASKFTKLGNYILGDKTLYGPDLVEYFYLMTPYSYYTQDQTLVNAEYDEMTGTIRFDMTLDGNPAVYTFYPELQPVDTIPNEAVLLRDYKTSITTSALYDINGEYYYTHDYLTVKLPFDTPSADIDVLYSNRAHFSKLSENNMSFTEFIWIFAENGVTPPYHVGFLEITFVPASSHIYEYMGARVIHTDPLIYVFKNGEMMHKTEVQGRGAVEIIGDYLIFGDGLYNCHTVLIPNLTVLGGTQFEQVVILSDGNCMANHIESAGYTIYSSDGNIVYTSPEEQNVLKLGEKSTLYYADGTYSEVGGEYALVKENGHLKLYEPYGTLLCDFGEISDKWSMHKMLGGYYSKEGYPKGAYFVFEDMTDSNQYGYHMYEYYYSFETGEHGLIDTGYQDFAYAKPVLYLYPTEETDITVTFEHPDRLTVDYPVYNDGWHVTASPDGTLTDAKGREYYALYWEESSDTPYYHFADGFCVKGEDSAPFLEEKLAVLGFTDKEANEFIIYWLPILESSEYNLIRFELTDEREVSNALHISPAPDSLLRVAMHIKALDAPLDIEKQELPSFERNGFTAVEWGGCIH